MKRVFVILDQAESGMQAFAFNAGAVQFHVSGVVWQDVPDTRTLFGGPDDPTFVSIEFADTKNDIEDKIVDMLMAKFSVAKPNVVFIRLT